MTTDPIADFLTRIRNAQAVSHLTVTVPFSQQKYVLAKILEKERFIKGVEKKGKKVSKLIKIVLKYYDEEPAISGLKRISKPGRRTYTSCQRIRSVQKNFGISIISTSKGLMTGRDAKKQALGGEIMCEIW